MLDTRLQQSSSCLDLSNNNSNNIGGGGGGAFHNSSNNIVHGHLGGSVTNNGSSVALHGVDAHERERLKAMLPTYRPAPDYETAVQLKYHTPSSELHHPQNKNSYANYQPQLASSASAVAMAGTPAAGGAIYYAGSQPDVHNAAAIYGDGVLLSQLAPHRYPDVAQPAAAMHAQHHHLTAAGVTMAPGGHSNSVSGGGAYIDLGHRLQMVRSKPPPPYPVNRLNSSSTPDLAVASHRPLMGYRSYVSGSSPDLVSNRNLPNAQYPYVHSSSAGAAQAVSGVAATNHALMHPHSSYMGAGHIAHSQPYLPHGTFENLNMIEEQPSILSQLRQDCLFLPPSYAEQNTIAGNNNNIYRQTSPSVQAQHQAPLPQAPQSQTHQQQQLQANANANNASLQRNTLNGSVEPIYENVPHARYVAAEPVVQRNMEQRSSGSSATSEAMRNRTASIQSAPGGTHAQPQQQMPPVPAVRHHHHHQHQQQQQQQQQVLQQQQQALLQQQQAHAQVQAQQQQAEAEAAAAAALNMHKYAERAASTELQFLEPTPPQRAVRAASAAPAVGHNSGSNQQPIMRTPPPRQNHHAHKTQQLMQNAASVSPTVDAAATTPNNTSARAQATTSSLHDDSTDSMLHAAQQQFSAMNISSISSNVSVSGAATMQHSTSHNQHHHHRAHNSTLLDTTANSSNTTHSSNTTNTTNSSSNTVKEGKRKKIWNILGRSKTPDKQKSATLGREKASSSNAAKTAAKIKLAQDDLNLMHRWSTGVSRLQPISGQYSKDKLVSNEKYIIFFKHISLSTILYISVTCNLSAPYSLRN